MKLTALINLLLDKVHLGLHLVRRKPVHQLDRLGRLARVFLDSSLANVDLVISSVL